jgi:hypothetical protein
MCTYKITPHAPYLQFGRPGQLGKPRADVIIMTQYQAKTVKESRSILVSHHL